MNLIPSVFALIDKGQNGLPLYIKNVMCESRLLWDYYNDNDPRVINAMKSILGIDPNSPVFFGFYAEHLIDPGNGEVLYSDENLDEFMQSVLDRHIELVAKSGAIALIPGV